VPDGSYSCTVGTTIDEALKQASEGKAKTALTLTSGGFSLMDGKIEGQIGEQGSGDASLPGNGGAFFTNSTSHALTHTSGIQIGSAAFSQDAAGAALAYIALNDGEYHFICFDQAKSAMTLTSEPQQTAEPPPESPPDPELTDAQKLEKLFAETPQQKGKERDIFGPLSLIKPDEGHYTCKHTRFFSDGDSRTSDQVGTDEDHTGFDLFADGSYRLKRNDGTFEKAGGPWRHNPVNGVVLFSDGTLEIYFKWPVHTRKKLETGQEVSVLYRTDYDYDGPIDDMTVCIFSGPTQFASPNAEIAARKERNLNPPPPGTPVQKAGLYYNQQWVSMMGFSNGTMPGSMYQQDYYYYRYLQTNGYVWLGGPPDDGDFSKLGCDKPMVDDNGEPTCTTYAVEDGLFSKPTIRIGHDAPVPFEDGDSSLTIDGTQYFFVAPQNALLMDKSVRYFNYNGMSMREGYFTFRKDGTYESTSSSGISYTTEIPDVSRTSVTGYFPGKDLKGTYAISGHTLTLTNENGGVAKLFFGYFSDGFLMIGGQPYFEPSD
jgi:hypothetical protein